jgi:hypothetical protein
MMFRCGLTVVGLLELGLVGKVRHCGRWSHEVVSSVLVCLCRGEATALWVGRVGLEQSVNEKERDRSKHDGEDTAVLVRWRIHSDPRCSSTTLGQKRHLA